jgi:hypothetical protein
VPASCARSDCRSLIVTPVTWFVAPSSARSWFSTPATRLGTVWNDCRVIRSFAARRRRVRATTSFSPISGCWRMRPRTSFAGSASSSESSVVSTLADRVSPSNIASSPKIAPGPSVASVIARPSGCSRVTRQAPLLIR